MSASTLPPLRSPLDLERVLEFEFVRATENAAIQAIHWLGRGEKEKADAAACAAIAGVFDILDIKGEVVIGEGIKDEAPCIFVGEQLGTWKDGAPRFDIAMDPIDGTTNLAKGLPNSISVIAAAQIPDGSPHAMRDLPSFYSHKIAYGPAVKQALEAKGNCQHLGHGHVEKLAIPLCLERLLHGGTVGDLVAVEARQIAHRMRRTIGNLRGGD